MADSSSKPALPADFSATHWTVVLQAGQKASPCANDALEQLCHRYWYPLYVFVRRQGLSPDDAQDITQGFFHQLLAKNYLKDVNRERGRFRSFLLASIKHYLLNERKRAARLKRGGGLTVLSLDCMDAEQRFRNEPTSGDSPERALDRTWATTVMDQALRRLGDELDNDDNGALYRSLRKFLSTEPVEGEYARLAAELGMTKNALGVAVHRLRKRYGELIRLEVANTVAHPLEVDDEMRHLHAVLSEK